MRMSVGEWWSCLRASPSSVATAVRHASGRQMVVAAATAIATAVVMGVATVLIPNDFFVREIAPVAWNYPVLVVTAMLSGLLAATYVRDDAARSLGDGHRMETGRTGVGAIGVVLSWFAVGCPVCNKLAVVALGYSGALSWFAPFQPVLAVGGIALLWAALSVRVRNTVRCDAPRTPRSEMA